MIILFWDASGKVISATDNGGTLLYTYYSNGQTKDIKFFGQTDAIASMTYDDRGFQKTLDDANAGIMNYVYNAYGELTEQYDDAQTKHYTMTYNKLGQMITREHSIEGITTWQYYPIGPAINQPRIITAPNGNRQTFMYDNLGRLSTLTETIDGNNYNTGYTYNNFGYLSEISYPSGFSVKREYDTKGYLQFVKKKSDNSVIWEGTKMNSLGQYTQYVQGNNIVTKKTFNDFGMTTQFKTYEADGSTPVDVEDLEFDWNLSTGNLNYRKDNIKTLTENFTYDNLNRLTSAQLTGQPAVTMTYETNGNIDTKNDLGDYVYSATAPNAVEKIWCGPVPYAPQQDITYTAFNKTATITEGNYELTYTYGPNQQRKKSVLTNTGTGNIEKTIIYTGSYEKITVGNNTYEVHYIAGGSGLTAINVRTNNGPDELFYVYTDHLGSILKLTDVSGTVVYETNFDAWGRERNPNDWTYTPNPNTKPEWLIRGFTGHEHLKEFSLINMNGRMYDPQIGRMLGPDNFIQYPYSSQSYNRYTYAQNNPLVYIDPYGNITWKGILVTIGINFVGVGTAVLTQGFMGFIGYYDDETGNFEMFVWASPVAIYFGRKEGEWQVYGQAVVTPDWGKKEKQPPPQPQPTPQTPPPVAQGGGNLVASSDPNFTGASYDPNYVNYTGNYSANPPGEIGDLYGVTLRYGGQVVAVGQGVDVPVGSQIPSGFTFTDPRSRSIEFYNVQPAANLMIIRWQTGPDPNWYYGITRWKTTEPWPREGGYY